MSCYLPTSPVFCCYKYEFIPIVGVDTKKKIQISGTVGYEIIELSCEDGTCLSEHLDKGKVKQPLFGIYLENDVIVRFTVSKARKESGDNEGYVKATAKQSKIISKDDLLVKYGYKLLIKLSYADTKENAYIDFYARDNKDDKSGWLSSEKTGTLKNIHVGRVKLLTPNNDKDVFSGKLYNQFNDENKVSMKNSVLCFKAVDNQFSKIVADSSLKLNSYKDLTGYNRANSYVSKGYVQSTHKFEQNKIWKRKTINGYKLVPYAFQSGQKNAFSNYVKNGLKKRVGYHIYYFTLLDAYHVLTLVIDNRNICQPMYRVLDQLKDRDWGSLSDLDQDLLAMTERNYEGACDSVKRKDHNSSIQLWKLKKK